MLNESFWSSDHKNWNIKEGWFIGMWSGHERQHGVVIFDEPLLYIPDWDEVRKEALNYYLDLIEYEKWNNLSNRLYLSETYMAQFLVKYPSILFKSRTKIPYTIEDCCGEPREKFRDWLAWYDKEEHEIRYAELLLKI